MSSSAADPIAVLASVAPLLPGLIFDVLGTESTDAPLFPVLLSPVEGALDGATFAAALGVPANAIQQQEPGQAVVQQLEMAHGAWPDKAKTAAKLGSILVELGELHAFVLRGGGEASHAAYLVGKAAGGALVGVRSSVVWT